MPLPSKDQYDDAAAWRKYAGELRQKVGELNRQIHVLDEEHADLQRRLNARQLIDPDLEVF
ncbi:MAG TPA: hypothetical protein PK781_03320 [Terrimesophilobacter sp.]|nr:hypothetical protein [Terrimesophilobacter sp.]HRP99472.1 hypothetical protein [Terrimesophilobacter sp.]